MNENSAELMESFMRLYGMMMRYHHHTQGRGPAGNPHRGQSRVLGILQMQPEISQKQLAFLLDMRPQSLGELLIKLEKNGYITRQASPKDKRVMNVQLTEAGKLAAQQAEKRQAHSREIFRCLNDSEQNELNQYLTRLINSLGDALGEEDGTKYGFEHSRELLAEHLRGHRHFGNGEFPHAHSHNNRRPPNNNNNE